MMAQYRFSTCRFEIIISMPRFPTDRVHVVAREEFSDFTSTITLRLNMRTTCDKLARPSFWEMPIKFAGQKHISSRDEADCEWFGLSGD